MSNVHNSNSANVYKVVITVARTTELKMAIQINTEPSTPLAIFTATLKVSKLINIDKLTMTSLFVATVYFVRNTDRIDFVCARTAPTLRGMG